MAVSEKNIRKFINKWQGRGKEKQDDQAYWTDLLSYIFELTDITNRIEPQKDVIGPDGNTKWIDIYIPETKVLIEQKSLNINLANPQAGHDGMTPYEQAKMYNDSLPHSEKARWIVTSNFAEIWIYDMESKKPEDSVTIVRLDNLLREYKQLRFLYDPQVEQIKREFEISKEAGDEIGKIYDALIKQYPENPSVDDLKNLNTFCVRIVFCYYAEDAGLFEEELFKKYIKSFNPQHLRNGLKELFRILNTQDSERDQFEEPSLLRFPYVNGGLFDGKNNVIPQLDENIQKVLIEAADFNWNDISPTIFGAIFESTLNQETRRNNGMHYTAVENIHKVIDPLFLDDLKLELKTIKESRQPNVKIQKLRDFQDKLASLTFFDPACGSGNFLTETYLSLRKLENEAIEQLSSSLMITLSSDTLIRVHLQQFYGIEINDFAVSVAKTALWIAENQMMKKTKELIINADTLNFLPLTSFTNIKEGNALRMDWNDVIPASECSYIMGNPPFVGTKKQSPSQKEDMKIVFYNNKKYKKLDYVSAWFKKTADYTKDTAISNAFVATNSITQGEMVSLLWNQLLCDYGMHINFAYRTFRWDSEAKIKAHVHCVIIGFSYNAVKSPIIYDGNETIVCKQINGYLKDAPPISIPKNQKSLFGLPEMIKGSQLFDGGNYIFETREDRDNFVNKEPRAANLIHRYFNSFNFLHSESVEQYCLFLDDCQPTEIKSMPSVLQKVADVKHFRENHKAKEVRAVKDTPSKYYIANIPQKPCIVIPVVSSQRREYIPIDFGEKGAIYTNALNYIEDTSLFLFGLLNSSVHNSWMRYYAGRLKSDYRYSKDLIYNNLPVPIIDVDMKEAIEKTAQDIITARNKYPGNSLADLYDPLTMPIELRKAHEANDKAVKKAYGFKLNMTEPEIVSELMKMYQKITLTK